MEAVVHLVVKSVFSRGLRRVVGVTGAIWKLRNSVSPRQRAVLRRAGDLALYPLGSIVGGSSELPFCALTFDDGPDATWTGPLLKLLADRQMHATFFLLTQQTRKFPELVEAIVDGGHEVGLHGDDHTRLTKLPVRDVLRRIKDSKSELQRLSGCPVRLFRPPYGAQSILTYLTARINGMQVVVWGPYAEDWVDGSPEDVANRGLAGIKFGDILLLHDGLELPDGQLPPTFDRLAMFEKVLDGFSELGLTGVSVSELQRLCGERKSAWFRP